jgi:hypothetical protein
MAAGAAAASTPISENTFLRLNDLDIHGDDAPSSQAPTRSAFGLPVFAAGLRFFPNVITRF